MATVIERLREAESGEHRTCEDACMDCGKCTCSYVILEHIPALLALADAAKAKDQAAIDKALAELEKEAQ